MRENTPGSELYVVVEACVAAGARVAMPGEFTRRAVANGKLDLLQAEGIRELVEADTIRQARRAQRHARGEMSRRMWALRDQLVELLALLEAALDFADEELGDVEDKVADARAECVGKIVDMLCSAGAGRRVVDGCRVVLCGAPNSGKSTLYNRLLRQERAIVSSSPGTTRDVVESEIEVEGAAVVLVDTAGLRDGCGSVEREGVRRAERAVAEADVVIRLWAADEEAGPEVALSPGSAEIRVRSKADLLPPRRLDQEGWLALSAVSGEGVDDLRRRLRNAVLDGVEEVGDTVMVGARQREALEVARRELEAAAERSPELAAEHVRKAVDAVGSVTGEAATEEVLDAVFKTFCLGK